MNDAQAARGPLKILVLDDSATDFELVRAELDAGGIAASYRHARDAKEFVAALDGFAADMILADYNLPSFSGLAALEMRNARAPDTPFIIVSGSLGDERAVATLRQGATDFVLKDRMARLPAAVTRALDEFARRRQAVRVATELETERKLMQAILQTAQALMVVVDADGRVVHMNPAAERALNGPPEPRLGEPFWEVFSTADDRDTARTRVRTALDSFGATDHGWNARTRSGRSVVWTSGGLALEARPGRLVLSGIDITDLEQAEAQAFFFGHYDAVTGLPNRKHFLKRLDDYRSRRDPAAPTQLAVMTISLSRIGEVGDSYGDTGIEKVLLEFARRLLAWPAQAELLARVADNSFVVAFESEPGAALESRIQQMFDALQAPVEIDGKPWQLPLRGGIALYPKDAREPYLLLRAAEAALHSAEIDPARMHPNRGHAFYTPALSDQARERLQMESELRIALGSEDQLVLHYQPQIDLRTGRVCGFESLIRWQHPRLGLVLPGRFIPLAEVCGLMTELGRKVLRRAARQITLWQQTGLAPPTVAINLSASQFSAPRLVEDIQQVLTESGVAPAMIEIELTESTSMHDPLASIEIMRRLRAMGLHVSIDDFGTGYSNLSYLKRFPATRLKLDQTFVRDIMTDADDRAISCAIIAMAHQLRLEVVAEGVETTEQLAALAQAGCDIAQGYLYSHPVPPEDCPVLMQMEFTPVVP